MIYCELTDDLYNFKWDDVSLVSLDKNLKENEIRVKVLSALMDELHFSFKDSMDSYLEWFLSQDILK